MENRSATAIIQAHIEAVQSAIALAPLIEQFADLLYQKLVIQDGRALTCGCGGSGADATHLVEEFVNRFVDVPRPALDAISLSVVAPIILGAMNDWGPDDVFARQVYAHARQRPEHAVLVCYSTSGESPSILKAARAARNLGASVVALTGTTKSDHPTLVTLADLSIIVPHTEVARIQEVHHLINHAVAEIVIERMVREGKNTPDWGL